jgi:glycosyltransferase involved in cell wall biosynthesis
VEKKSLYRIGRVGTRVFPDRGGPANHIFNITLHQNMQQCQNILVATKPLKGIAKEIGKSSILLPIQPPKIGGSFVSSILFALSYLLLASLASILVFSRNYINVIHAHSPGISGIAGLFASRILGKPFVYTVHGIAGLPHKWNSERNIPEYLLERILIRHSNGLIVVSNDYLKTILQYRPKGLISCISNGVDTIRFQPMKNAEQINQIKASYNIPTNAIILTWVGNFNLNEKVRGIVDTIKALENLNNENTFNWRFVLVGNGLQKNDMQKLVSNSKIRKNLVFLGHQKDINKILGISDIFVLVSHHEGSPNALLEAMASGLACIGSNTGGIPDIIRDAGILIEVGDTRQLSKSILLLLSNSEARLNYAGLARKRAEANLSWYAAAYKTINFYSEILKQKKTE